MRQTGVLAAAGLYALHHNIDRLADDHARAAMLAKRLAEAAPSAVDLTAVETNIVLVEVGASNSFVARARDEGVLVGAISPTVIRVMTHLDVDDEQVGRAADILAKLLGQDESA
jgi:threonine aldolase